MRENYVNFASRYEKCLNSDERKKAVFEEVKSIKDNYHLNDIILNNISKHYFVNHHVKLGNISKTIKFIDSILIYYGLSEEERNKFLVSNFRMYLCDYNDFRIRLAIFNKCGLFEEALFSKNRFLSNFATSDTININKLYSIVARKSFNITFDEIEHYSKANINFKELINKYRLTNETIKEMDNELILKIKSYSNRKSLGK